MLTCVPASAGGARLEFTSFDFACIRKNRENVLLGLWPRGRQLRQTAGLCRGRAISIAATCAVAQPWGWRCTRIAAGGFGFGLVRGNLLLCVAGERQGRTSSLRRLSLCCAPNRGWASSRTRGGMPSRAQGSPARPRPPRRVPAATLPLLPPPARGAPRSFPELIKY